MSIVKKEILVNIILLSSIMAVVFVTKTFFNVSLASDHFSIMGIIILMTGFYPLLSDNNVTVEKNDNILKVVLLMYNSIFIMSIFFNLGRIVMQGLI